MSFGKLLLLPTLIKSGIGAPRERAVAWNQYWGGIQQTGAGGDVLWDGASEPELRWCCEQAERFFVRELPVLDAGTGNGRYARALARSFDRVVGLDVSENAVRLATAESEGCAGVSFRVGDLTKRDMGPGLARELGEVNVFVRGVFHVLSDRGKEIAADNLRVLLGERGVLLLLETAFPGSALDYLQFLGAQGSTLPPLVLRCVRAGLPTPQCFGRQEFARFFPARSWKRLAEGDVEIHAAGTRPGDRVQIIPGYYAAVRPQ